MKSLSEMNGTLAWYICLDDNRKDAATTMIKEIFTDDDRVNISVLADDVMALEDYFHTLNIIFRFFLCFYTLLLLEWSIM